MDTRRQASDVPLLEDRNDDDVVDARRPKRPPELLTNVGSMQSPESWSPDGRTLAFTQMDDPESGSDIYMLSLDGGPHAARARADEVFGGLAEVLTGRQVARVLVERVGTAGGVCDGVPRARAEDPDLHRRRNGPGVAARRTGAVLPQWRSDDGRRRFKRPLTHGLKAAGYSGTDTTWPARVPRAGWRDPHPPTTTSHSMANDS